MTIELGDPWYRLRDYRGEDGPVVHWIVVHVMKITPCGVWVGYGHLDPKHWTWVCFYRHAKSERRKYYATKEDALVSYRIRKRRQVQHLSTWHDHAIVCRDLAEKLTSDFNVINGDRDADRILNRQHPGFPT